MEENKDNFLMIPVKMGTKARLFSIKKMNQSYDELINLLIDNNYYYNAKNEKRQSR